jgi:hypothetical protein
VIALIDEARSLGYEPEDPLEWLTYIEAQALTGNIETAEKVSPDTNKITESARGCVKFETCRPGLSGQRNRNTFNKSMSLTRVNIL